MGCSGAKAIRSYMVSQVGQHELLLRKSIVKPNQMAKRGLLCLFYFAVLADFGETVTLRHERQCISKTLDPGHREEVRNKVGSERPNLSSDLSSGLWNDKWDRLACRKGEHREDFCKEGVHGNRARDSTAPRLRGNRMMGIASQT